MKQMPTGSPVICVAACVAFTFAMGCGGAAGATTGKNVPSPANTPVQNDWVLCLMEEPALSPIGKPPGYFALRILYEPTFRNPIAVRYESNDGHNVYRAVRLYGQFGYDLGAIKRQEQSQPTAAEVSAVKQALQSSGYWSLPPTDSASGADGSILTVETVYHGKHRYIVRLEPEYNSRARGLDGLVALFTSEFEKVGFWPLSMPTREEIEHLVPQRLPPPPPPPPGYAPHPTAVPNISSKRTRVPRAA